MSATQQTVGIFTTDAQLRIRSWDGWLAAATGVSAERARGAWLAALFPEVERRGMLRRFERVLQEGVVEVLAPKFHHYLLACAVSEPSSRYERMQQHVTIAPLVENGVVVGAIVTIEDVTARLTREQELAEQLASDDEMTRLKAAEMLAAGAGAAAAEKLLDRLGDESWRVRKAAVAGLARQAGAEQIQELLRALREEHQDPGVLNSALQVLALSGVDAIEPLAAFLEDEDADLRIYATQALGDQQDRRAIAALMGALDDENENVRYHAIEALGKLRASEATEALVEIAESRDFFLAFPALDTLRLLGDARVAPRLVPLLDDALLCAPAAETLGRLGDEEVAPPLLALLNTPNAPTLVIAQALATLYDGYEKSYQEGALIAEQARAQVNEVGVGNLLEALEQSRGGQAKGEALRPLALVLGWLEGEASERALMQLLGQPTARQEVIEALVRYGERVTRLLVEQLRAEEPEARPEVRKAAIVALGRIGSKDAVPALVCMLEEASELAILAAGALGKIGDRAAFPALLELLGHAEAAVRQAAVAAINSLGHPQMAAQAKRLLTDEDPRRRESAVKIAGYFGYGECADLLLERCHDEVESIRRAAVEALPFLEDERVEAALVDALKNGTPPVRAAAAKAMAQMDGDAARPHLLAALTDSDTWVRYFAIRSIGAHRYAESLEKLEQLAETEAARHVRIAAIDALGRIGGERAVAVLARLLAAAEPTTGEGVGEAADLDVWRAVIQALGQLAHPVALPPLLAALRARRLSARVLRLEVLQALGGRGGRDAVQALQWTAAADADEEIRQAAIATLARISLTLRDEAREEALDEEPDKKRAAAGDGAAEALTALIDLTAEASCRETAIAALAQRASSARVDEWKIERLGEGMAHRHATVRRAVIEALGRMKHPHATAWLSRGLDDEEPTVRAAAAQALGYLGSRAAERKLLTLLRQDPEPGVRRAAERALRR